MHIQEGEIYGLIGKNGAGKTHTKTILGLIEITDGENLHEKSGKNNLRIYNRIGDEQIFKVLSPPFYV